MLSRVMMMIKRKMINPTNIINKGLCDYHETWSAMRAFTENRTENTQDECWCVQHYPVYTLGLNIQHANRPLNSLAEAIPVVETDRGGQITYHGPGQLIIYFLLDLRRRRLAVKELVARLEQGVLAFLSGYGVKGHLVPGAPGVYVNHEKIASLGLKIRRGCTYHGVSLNADMDLTPFSFIHPCGYEGLKVTQLKDLGINVEQLSALHTQFSETLIQVLTSND